MSSGAIVRDKVPDLLKAVRELTKLEVLVGVPDENADRPPEDGHDAPITNAGIGYVQEFGAPEHNIPARPHLIPGVIDAQDKFADVLKKAAGKAIDGDVKQVKAGLTRAGIIAENSVKQKITDGPFAPLSPRTIQARAARGRKGAKEYLSQLAQGQVPDVGLVKPLIDTGAYRRAITSVVRPKGK